MATKTFTIKKVQGEFTMRNLDPRGFTPGNLLIGRIEHETLVINGVDYGPGHIDVLYGRKWWKDAAEFFFWPNESRWRERDFTDSAEKILGAGIYPEIEEFFTAPTIEDINAGVLEDAYRAGIRYGENYASNHRQDGVDGVIREWARAYEPVTGNRLKYDYSLPTGPGIVSELDVKAEFLAAAKSAMADQLAKVEAQISKTEAA